MIKFNKVFYSKIISLILACVFLFTNITYGIDIPERPHLRKPLDFNGFNITPRYLCALLAATYHNGLKQNPEQAFAMVMEEMSKRNAEELGIKVTAFEGGIRISHEQYGINITVYDDGTFGAKKSKGLGMPVVLQQASALGAQFGGDLTFMNELLFQAKVFYRTMKGRVTLKSASQRDLVELFLSRMPSSGIEYVQLDEEEFKQLQLPNEESPQGNVNLILLTLPQDENLKQDKKSRADRFKDTVVKPEGGIKAINFQNLNGTWTIIMLKEDYEASKVQAQATLCHELREIALREQGYDWQTAHKIVEGQLDIQAVVRQAMPGQEAEIGAAQQMGVVAQALKQEEKTISLPKNIPYPISYIKPIVIELPDGIKLTVKYKSDSKHGYSIIQEGNSEGFKDLFDGEVVEIGRDSPGRFTLNNRVSRKHLRIEIRGNVVIITDLNSTNGTLVRYVQSEFDNLLERVKIQFDGEVVLDRFQLNGFNPEYKIVLNGVTYYLSKPYMSPENKRPYFTAFIYRVNSETGEEEVFARTIYKSNSQNIWRVASHRGEGLWIGKGLSEETTNAPLEIQSLLEKIYLAKGELEIKEGFYAVLKKGGHIAPEEFVRTISHFGEEVNRGIDIGSFTKKNDPSSFKFISGYEPDFNSGITETFDSYNPVYGRIKSYRIFSTNRKVQFIFNVDSENRVWIGAVQATSQRLTRFGVRADKVNINEDLLMPANEYYQQIPANYRVSARHMQGSYYDAYPFIAKIPVVKDFIKKVLGFEPGSFVLKKEIQPPAPIQPVGFQAEVVQPKDTMAISQSTTFAELYAVLDSLGSLQGKENSYTSAELKRRIEGLRQGRETDIEIITRTSGLRDKVEELLKQEQMPQAAQPRIVTTIIDATTFAELYAVLDSLGSLQGKENSYTSAELKRLIEGLRQGRETDIEIITRASGLRDKVKELLKQERNLGALKQIGDEDLEEAPAETQDEWRKAASAKLPEARLIKGLEITAKFITDDDTMPSSMSAYHLYDNEGGLVIVIRSKISPEITDEAVHHEAKEATWIKQLTLKDGLVTKDVQRQAHILAAAEDVMAFGKEGLTPYHQSQLDTMAKDKLRRLMDEDRTQHHNLVERYLGRESREKIERYEKVLQKNLQVLDFFYEELAMLTNDERMVSLTGDESIASLNSFSDVMHTGVTTYRIMMSGESEPKNDEEIRFRAMAHRDIECGVDKVLPVVNPNGKGLTVYYPAAGFDIAIVLASTDATTLIYSDLTRDFMGQGRIDNFTAIIEEIESMGGKIISQDIPPMGQEGRCEIKFELPSKDGRSKTRTLIYYSGVDAEEFIPLEIYNGYDVLWAATPDMFMSLPGIHEELFRLLKEGGFAVFGNGGVSELEGHTAERMFNHVSGLQFYERWRFVDANEPLEGFMLGKKNSKAINMPNAVPGVQEQLLDVMPSLSQRTSI